MITAVDLLRGIAALVGWERIEVPGATGYLDTDYAAKGRAGVEALKKYDIVCVHVEASDEASHEGRCDEKVKALEEIDRHVVGPLLEALQSHGDWRIMISPDHPTFLRTKIHTHGNVPVAMAGTGIAADEFTSYGDTNAAQVEAGVRRRLERDAVVYRKEINHREHRGHREIENLHDFDSASLVLSVSSVVKSRI